MSSHKLIIGSRNYSSWSLRGWLAMQQSSADFEEVVEELELARCLGTQEDALRGCLARGEVLDA